MRDPANGLNAHPIHRLTKSAGFVQTAFEARRQAVRLRGGFGDKVGFAADLAVGGNRIRTYMGLFLSSGCFWFVGSSLFGAGKPFFVPSPAIGFAERAEGVKGPKR